jgi:RimJ/RimL family protein N-acetyltransferase
MYLSVLEEESSMIMIETERLKLRRFVYSDWKDLHEYLSKETVVRFEPYGVLSEDECKKEAEKRSRNDAFWAVCLKKKDKMIGNVYFSQKEPPGDLTWEIGFVFNPDYYGKGYATESCKSIMNYGFDRLDVLRIVASCDPENIPSWKLLERLNMKRQEHLQKNEYFQKQGYAEPFKNDSIEYSISKNEWQIVHV